MFPILEGPPAGPSHPECTRCDRYRGTLNPGLPVRCVSSAEPSESRPVLVVLGHKPGHEEDRTGEVFVGRSSMFLWPLLEGLPFRSVADVYLGNLVRCTSSGDDPSQSEVNACRGWLHDDLDVLGAGPVSRTRCLLLLGAATAALFLSEWGLKQGDVFSCQGRTIKAGRWEWRVFSTFHPAALRERPSLILSISDHMELVYSCLIDDPPQVYQEPLVVPAGPPHRLFHMCSSRGGKPESRTDAHSVR